MAHRYSTGPLITVWSNQESESGPARLPPPDSSGDLKAQEDRVTPFTVNTKQLGTESGCLPDIYNPVKTRVLCLHREPSSVIECNGRSFLSPLALGRALPLLRDAVDLLQLFLLVVAERSRQALVPSCVAVLDP